MQPEKTFSCRPATEEKLGNSVSMSSPRGLDQGRRTEALEICALLSEISAPRLEQPRNNAAGNRVKYHRPFSNESASDTCRGRSRLIAAGCREVRAPFAMSSAAAGGPRRSVRGKRKGAAGDQANHDKTSRAVSTGISIRLTVSCRKGRGAANVIVLVRRAPRALTRRAARAGERGRYTLTGPGGPGPPRLRALLPARDGCPPSPTGGPGPRTGERSRWGDGGRQSDPT